MKCYGQILDQYAKVCMKGNNHNFEAFDDEFLIVKKQYLWCDKLWIAYNQNTKNIHIYEATTMQLHQIIPFPYFEIQGIEWNEEQSLFIAFDGTGRQYCTIKRI